MKHFVKHVKTILLAAMVAIAGNAAAAEPVELFSFHTNIYAEQGISNLFSILISTDKDMLLYVDCGAGADVYELEALTDTLIYCSVNEQGNVVVSGESAEDAAAINYLNAEGCYIESIDLTRLTNLDVLNLSHNVMKDIDLSHNDSLRAIYISDNTFTKETPLVIGNKPELVILEMQIVDWLDPDFDLTKYPNLGSFDAYHCPTLTKIDPTNCPNLLQLTLEMTNVSTVDVSKNPNLLILNISETAVKEIDLTHNTKLEQLYAEHVSGTYNVGVKLDKLDVTSCPAIGRLVCNGNNLTELDLSNAHDLVHLSCKRNRLTSLDLTNKEWLREVQIDYNCFDFATLPMNPGTWENYTYEQRPLHTERSYKEGTVLDFSNRVLRQGTTTDMALYTFDVTTPNEWVKMDTSYYSYANGVVTLKKAYTDSLFIVFANSLFLEYNLQTEPFMVKTESEYGKPTNMFSFMPAVDNPRYKIGIEGATPETPKTFYIDYYDANYQTKRDTLTTTGATLADATWQQNQSNAYNTITVFVPENTIITALALDSLGLYDLSIDRLIALRELSLENNQLYNIDLTRNRFLRTLNLSRNNLRGTFSLAGINDLFAKNVLRDINLSHNEITELTLNPLLSIRHLDVSHNAIEALDLADADSLHTADLSYNQLQSLRLTYCGVLSTLDVSHNRMNEIQLPSENNIRDLAINDNCFTMASLPLRGNISEERFIYAPQQDIVIATKGPCADLTAQDVTIDGQKTVFRWIKKDGTALVEGTDYTITNGYTRFVNTDADSVYCAISHAAYPAFAGDNVLKTTKMLVAGMPTNQIASFVTANDNDTVSLSFAANADATALYIDWEGNDNVQQYVLGTSYRLFSAVTHKDVTVRVYTYEPNEAITVFSMTGATLKSFDGSKLNDAICIRTDNAGLSSITLPTNKETLSEVGLSGNAFTSIDFLAAYPNITSLSVSENQLTSLDLSILPKLQVVGASNNAITTTKFNNPALWYLDLTGNRIAEIDFTGAANIEQMSLSHNLLKTIDVEPLSRLKALLIDANCFTFQTLPLPKSQYILYNYYNQAPLDVQVTRDSIVDLSSQASVGGYETTYTWYLGVPVWNSDMGMFEGEELYEDIEYTVDNGVTTFLKSFEGVMCLLTNPTFPNLYLYTDLLDVTGTTAIGYVTADGISVSVRGRDIVLTADAACPVALYTVGGLCITTTTTNAGETVLTAPAAGAYIVRAGAQACKVVVP